MLPAYFRLSRLLLAWSAALCLAAPAWSAEPVYIGVDEAYGIKTNSAPKAIERGVLAAMDEINARGGVLGGRPLKLITTDNQGISARGRDNFIDLASRPGLVAVLTGKYSPVTVETVPEANRLKVPLVSVWGSADPITDNPAQPSFVFRLSLKDAWGVEALMLRAKSSYQARRVCAVLPNTSWGRSGDQVLVARSATHGVGVVATRWYNWGDQDFRETLAACARARAQAIILVANEREAAFLLTQLSQVPAAERLPVVAHWGLTGGVIHQLAPQALAKVDMQVIQTFTFIGNQRPAAMRLANWIMRDARLSSVREIPSPVGSAHAYDMTHLLALAVNKAGSTRGDDVRRALESLPPFEGAVRRYAPAFTPERHDALGPKEVLFVRIEKDGALTPLK